MKTIALSNANPIRLDLALAEALGVSRTKAQRLMKDGAVTVDGDRATPHTPVSKANSIRIKKDALEADTDMRGTMPVLDIVYEDDDVVVCNKPAGLLAHPTNTSREYTLADALIAHNPIMQPTGKNARGLLVHRLDRDASGVIIAAKHEDTFLFLKKAFAERRVDKRYSVLVHGNNLPETGVITFPIARSARGTGRMAARPHHEDGKDAYTEYTVLERFPQYTLLDVRIATGRTHQIRAHLFALQHPVVGDTLYMQRGVKTVDLGRLFLHARELTVPLPSGTTQTFTAPLPCELKEFLSALRQRYHRTSL